MSLEDAWKGEQRYFQQPNSRSSQPRVWAIKVEGANVYTTWGQLGGAMQTAVESHLGVNHGKKNEMKPAAYALDRAKEQIRKKRREGYQEHDAQGNLIDEPVQTLIDFNSTLPESLCFYKPDNEMGDGMLKKAEQKRLWYGVKRNGMMHALVRPEQGPVQIYSRRMHRQHDDEKKTVFTWDNRFPHLVEQATLFMPPCSIVLGELVFAVNGRDQPLVIGSFTKSLTPQSLADQAGVGLPNFYIWDIAFWKNLDLVSTTKVKERYELIHEINYSRLPNFEPIQLMEFDTPDDAKAYAKANGLEGFVAVDPEGIYGDRAYNFKGKPDRPGKFCSKVKPAYEDDFIVYWDPHHGHGDASTKGRYATADKPGIGSVALYQYNSRGELIYISNCASGMTEEMRRDWANPALFPQVWQVIYTERKYMNEGDDTNALTHPRFNMVRTDKSAQECVNPRLG